MIVGCGARSTEEHSDQAKRFETLALRVDGMHCDGCAKTIQTALAAVAGVREATVRFEASEAIVLIDPSRVGVDSVIRTIQNKGYTASVKDQGSTERPGNR